MLPRFDFKFDMIFADPPYFLSNGGISYQAGKVVCVDKGDWYNGGTPESIMEFNAKCRYIAKDVGSFAEHQESGVSEQAVSGYIDLLAELRIIHLAEINKYPSKEY